MKTKKQSETSAVRVLSELIRDEEARQLEEQARIQAAREAQEARKKREEAELRDEQARLCREREQAAAEAKRRDEIEEKAAIEAAILRVKLQAAIEEQRIALSKQNAEPDIHPLIEHRNSSMPLFVALLFVGAMSLVLAVMWFTARSEAQELEARLASERASHFAAMEKVSDVLTQSQSAIEQMGHSLDESQRRLGGLRERCQP